MAKNKRLKVIDESETGLNKKFLDLQTGSTVTRGYVADHINEYEGYHVMRKDNKRIIRSNPDKSKNNNLE